jgi:hypothetical protein
MTAPNQDKEHRPSAKNRHHDVGRDGAGNKAADETLRDNKGPGRNRYTALEPGQKDGRRDRAKHESGGQANQFKDRDADDGPGEKHGPLQSRGLLAQVER